MIRRLAVELANGIGLRTSHQAILSTSSNLTRQATTIIGHQTLQRVSFTTMKITINVHSIPWVIRDNQTQAIRMIL